MIKIWIQLGLIAVSIQLLVSCGGYRNAQLQDQSKQISLNMRSCIDRSPVGNRARCILIAYNDVNRSIDNSNYAKAPVLNFLNNYYELMIKVDRGQIKNEQDYQVSYNRINNQLQQEFQVAQANSAAANAAASMRQQQMFMNAYKLLTPNGSGGINCYPIQGGPSFGPTAGGMVCQ